MTSTNTPHILVFTDWFLPGYKAGGPIRSLANLIATLTDVQFSVVTRNTDHYSDTPYPGIPSNQWIQHSANCRVYYFEESAIGWSSMSKLLKEQSYDRIYLNSLFSPKFTLLPLVLMRKLGLSKRCILAPRGMLKAGALSIKGNKKQLFLRLSQWMGLFKAIQWHATSDEEYREIQHHFPHAQAIHLAPNVATAITPKKNKPTKSPGELLLICIARISAEKGIKEALEYLKAAELKGTIRCDFFGTIQNPEFLSDCQRLADSIEGVQIAFHGEIPPSEIPAKLSSYHFFYLPTWGENFGHAIAESLNSGTPVIISNKTPWLQLQSKNAGWDLPLESTAFVPVLQQCVAMTDKEYQMKSESAYQLAQQISQDKKIIEAQYALFGML